VFDPAAAFVTVEHLATRIGPREAASAAFDDAVRYVQSRFASLGYRVTTTPVPVPAGDSWGVPVGAGTSENVIADPAGFNPAEPHVVIGAHLDTVAVAPGAEDNGSGVAVVLELARMVAQEPPPMPVRFIAFGAEEPRGRGDDLHHFGSQDYVAALSAAERRAIRAMVSLDRVGVPADAVPVSTGGTGTPAVMEALVAAAGSAGIPARQDDQNRASDHWSFEKADIPAARLGSVPYAAYHTADDLPPVVDPEQLDRVGTIVWTWLQTL
jgi:Zn-dependent M28 family amino/carboxypeptidase